MKILQRTTRPTPLIDFLIPAHNEGRTVANVIRACQEAFGEDVARTTVIADHCTDETGRVAEEFGARLVERSGSVPSKAEALCAGVRASSAPYLFFVDADCIGLRPAHLIEIAEPVLGGRVLMSVGTFDYGSVLTPIVERVPWSAGQRILHRDLFPLNDARLTGYNVEVLINERIGLHECRTASGVMCGVGQRTKRQKLGFIAGTTETWRMWRSIATNVKAVDLEAYRIYATSIEARSGQRYSGVLTRIGYYLLLGFSRLLAPTWPHT